MASPAAVLARLYEEAGIDVPVAREALRRSGVGDPCVLVGLADAPVHELARLAEQLLGPSAPYDRVAEATDELFRLGEVAAPHAKRARGRLVYATTAELAGAGRLLLQSRAAASREVVPSAVPTPPVPASRARAAWPSRLRRAKELADPGARAEALAGERERWVTELVVQITECDLPAVEAAGPPGSRELLLRRLAAGKRLATLRKRLRDWRRWRCFLDSGTGAPFPPDVATAVAYLEARAAEPVGPSTLISARLALAFIEASGAVPVGDRCPT